MAGFATQGPLVPQQWMPVFPKTQFGIAQAWYVNRAPLTSRRPSLPCPNVSFNLVGYKFRPRNISIVADPGTAGTTFSVADASYILNGDIISLPTGEIMEVISTPDPNANTFNVRRGIAATTPATLGGAAVTTGAPVTAFNIGNSRTGGEKFQSAIIQTPGYRTQWVQTFQHVVSVGGLMQAVGAALPLPPATPTPFEKNKMDSLQNLMDDVENSSLYGTAEGIGQVSTGTTNTRSKMGGLLSLISTNAVTAPTNASSFKPSDFEGQVLSPIRANGGQPSIIHMSNGFRAGLVNWGLPLQRYVNGYTAFGVEIVTYRSPFIGDIELVENMWLNRLGNAAIVLTEEECRFRTLEELNYKPYGRSGDTGVQGEGDWIHRTAIELDNEFHHGYVTGITGFAPQA